MLAGFLPRESRRRRGGNKDDVDLSDQGGQAPFANPEVERGLVEWAGEVFDDDQTRKRTAAASMSTTARRERVASADISSSSSSSAAAASEDRTARRRHHRTHESSSSSKIHREEPHGHRHKKSSTSSTHRRRDVVIDSSSEASSSSSTFLANEGRGEHSNDSRHHRHHAPMKDAYPQSSFEYLSSAPASKFNRHSSAAVAAAAYAKDVISAKACSGCGGCGNGGCKGGSYCPKSIIYADDGYSSTSSRFLYSSMGGYNPAVDLTAATFTLAQAENGWVRMSPTGAFTLAQMEAQIGFDANTDIGDVVALTGLANAIFNTLYLVAGLPASNSGSYLLQPVNYLDCRCLAPIVNDYFQIRHGLSQSIYTISTIDQTTLSWTFTPTSLLTLTAALPVYIFGCC